MIEKSQTSTILEHVGTSPLTVSPPAIALHLTFHYQGQGRDYVDSSSSFVGVFMRRVGGEPPSGIPDA